MIFKSHDFLLTEKLLEKNYLNENSLILVMTLKDKIISSNESSISLKWSCDKQSIKFGLFRILVLSLFWYHQSYNRIKRIEKNKSLVWAI